ncbi:MAG: glycosyltransferase [Gemmatimonas sp.]
MHIGFIIDAFDVGGSELNAIKTAEALTRQSFQLTVFHMHRDGPLRERYEHIGAHLVHIPLKGFATPSFPAVVRLIRRESIHRRLQLLHSHCVYGNIVGAAVRWSGVHRLPVMASRRWTGFAVRPALRPLNALAQSAADAVLVNSPSLLRRVKSESPFSNPQYVPNVLPDSAFRQLTSAQQQVARATFGLADVSPIVGCVARLEPVKDHRLLIAAWALVISRVPSAVLAIVGNGSLRATLEQQAVTLGLAANIQFLGEIRPSDLPHSLFDICVLSSSDEGFPNSLLEGMAQRKAIVATSVGGVSDLVQHNVNGLLVAHGDPNALANALIELLTQPAMADRLASNGALTVAAHRESVVVETLVRNYRAIARD